jgi:hypothetical protein
VSSLSERITLENISGKAEKGAEVKILEDVLNQLSSYTIDQAAGAPTVSMRLLYLETLFFVQAYAISPLLYETRGNI